MAANQRASIVMSDAEVQQLLATTRIATLATLYSDGRPHLVPMWFGLIDGEIWMETKSKSQKAVNLRRDPRITVQVEAGQAYDELRGVCIDATAELTDNEDTLYQVARSMWERYWGPYSPDVEPGVRALMHNRVAIRVVAQRVRTWDHRKLGLPPMGVSGTTAAASRS